MNLSSLSSLFALVIALSATTKAVEEGTKYLRERDLVRLLAGEIYTFKLVTVFTQPNHQWCLDLLSPSHL